MNDKRLQQLKPCPWCGSSCVEYDAYSLDHDHLWTTITCKTCGAESADQANFWDWQTDADKDEDAVIESCYEHERVRMIERWNTRCSDDPEACPLCGNTKIDQEGYDQPDGTAECYCICNELNQAGECHTHGPVVIIPPGTTEEEEEPILRASWTKRV